MMINERHLVILNPVAAKGLAGERREELEQLLIDQGLVYDLVLTEYVWHAAELAREAGKKGYKVVVACGGDGTMNEVINGLMIAYDQGEAIPAMAGLALGRGNDFAHGADIPYDLPTGVTSLIAGQARSMDVGIIRGGLYPEGRYFGNGVGIGFDTIVGLEAAKMKLIKGFMTYVAGALKTFIMYPTAPLVRFEHDSNILEQESHQISIMNGDRMGGTFFMAPDARNHDGIFDFCIATRLRRRDMAAAIVRYTKGTQAELPFFKMGRSRHFSIEAEKGGLYVHADGETICKNGTRVEIDCLPGRIQMICSFGLNHTKKE
ncbi:diacylglycerol kinase family lipid kinase [Treponema sp.]